MKKYFLYDPGSITPDGLRLIKGKGYECTPLTDDADFFWKYIGNLQNGGVFALLSHGNSKGPLAVKGDSGDDIDLDEFSKAMLAHNVQLYLLSCHTGENPCSQKLTEAKIQFVAPVGYAAFSAGSGVVNVKSVDKSNKSVGWSGPLAPKRSTGYVSLP